MPFWAALGGLLGRGAAAGVTRTAASEVAGSAAKSAASGLGKAAIRSGAASFRKSGSGSGGNRGGGGGSRGGSNGPSRNDRQDPQEQVRGNGRNDDLIDRIGSKAFNLNQIISAAESAAGTFGIPSYTHVINVTVIGGPGSTIQSLHYIAMSAAWGRLLQSDNIGVVPFKITANWDVTNLAVQIQVSYVLNSITALGSRSAECITKLIFGPQVDTAGGDYPATLKSFARGVGVSDIPALLGSNLTLPYVGKAIASASPINAGQVIKNPAPAIGDGVRTSLLAVVGAALAGSPTDGQEEYPIRQEVGNTYNNFPNPTIDRGNPADGLGQQSPPKPANPTGPQLPLVPLD